MFLIYVFAWRFCYLEQKTTTPKTSYTEIKLNHLAPEYRGFFELISF